MPITAKLRYLRIAPRKVRLVADLIRGKRVEKAQTTLSFTTKKAAGPLLKLLKSAVANAKHNFQMEETNLYISEITVDGGPKYKRWQPRARGRAYEIQKRTSHITLVLNEITRKPKKVKKVKKAKKIEKVYPKLVERARPEPAEEVEKIPKVEKPKPKPELGAPKPKIEKGIRRIFRRKAF